MEKILSRHFFNPEARRLPFYLEKEDGYEAARKALTAMAPQAVIDEVAKSNLRGLGGAGFPAGRKWGFIPQDSPKPRYLVVNCDESEPGTFKDRHILEWAPHALLEGLLIASFAIGAHQCFIYARGEYARYARMLQQAVDETYQAGFLGKNILGTGYDLEVRIHLGAGAYICGEESALLESLEGKKGWPRLKPPFPAVSGLFGCPTIINNTETISYVPAIIHRGGEWFASLGTPRNGGLRLFSVSGHVNRPGVYELPLGTPLREIIYAHAGGVRNDRKLRAVIPGGSSTPVLAAGEIDVKMDFDSLAAIGSALGSAGVIVMDETTCLVKALAVLAKFYQHESCGQCTPCREGTGWLARILNRILEGRGVPEDLENLLRLANNIKGNTICALGDGAALPVLSFVTKFRDEFESHVLNRNCLAVP
ncbi:MAG: NADH-quinone oxidoreductase subunit NuoF [Acidobacteria bacterium]|nr:NADH-quinone oxidoreductase subunit NuoF [Acidobacteriota bacterium]